VAAVVLLAGLEAHGGPRTVAALVFLATAPAAGFVRMLRLTDRVAELVVTIAASFALDTMVAEAMVYSHTWSAAAGFGVLAGIGLLGAGLAARGQGRRA